MDQYTQNLYRELFSGGTSAYGVSIYTGEKDDSGKYKCNSYTESGAPGPDKYQDHLNGVKGLGIRPMRDDGQVTFATIDLDVYDKDLTETVKLLYSHNLPLNCFRSKSGGLHIYVFFEAPVLSKDATNLLTEVVGVFNLKSRSGDIEIFPKNDTSWINLPFFNAAKSNQVLYLPDGSTLTHLPDVLEKLKNSKTTIDKFQGALDRLPLADAPPCLQTLLITKAVGEGQRNELFFNMGVYLRSKHGEDDFSPYMSQANYQHLDNPLSDGEIKALVQSHRKKSYAYKCKEAPICAVCRKGQCYRREHGVRAAGIPDIDYGQLVKYIEDPVRWEWNVGGQIMHFTDAKQLINPTEFRAKCVDQLDILPKEFKKEEWNTVVRTALAGIEQVDNSGEDLNEGGLFRAHFEKYIQDRPEAREKSHIKQGKIYIDDEYYYFDNIHLYEYLNTRGMRDLTTQKMRQRLEKMGVKNAEMKNEHGVRMRVRKIEISKVNRNPHLPQGATPQEEAPSVKPDFEKYKEKPDVVNPTDGKYPEAPF